MTTSSDALNTYSRWWNQRKQPGINGINKESSKSTRNQWNQAKFESRIRPESMESARNQVKSAESGGICGIKWNQRNHVESSQKSVDSWNQGNLVHFLCSDPPLGLVKNM